MLPSAPQARPESRRNQEGKATSPAERLATRSGTTDLLGAQRRSFELGSKLRATPHPRHTGKGASFCRPVGTKSEPAPTNPAAGDKRLSRPNSKKFCKKLLADFLIADDLAFRSGGHAARHIKALFSRSGSYVTVRAQTARYSQRLRKSTEADGHADPLAEHLRVTHDKGRAPTC